MENQTASISLILIWKITFPVIKVVHAWLSSQKAVILDIMY
jgi:hypothetical protein